MRKLRTIFFGTPDFSVPTLEMLSHHPQIDIVCVVSMPDRPAGRSLELKSPEVIEFAKNARLPFHQSANINRDTEQLATWEREGVDLFIVLAFAQFLGERLLKLPRFGAFNIHTSLLPKYRGAAPIQHALWNGDTESGVSIQRMVKKMDAGDLAISHPMKIHPHETGGLLSTRLKFQAALSCHELLDKLLSNTVRFTPQDEGHVSFAPTLKKSDGFLSFANQTKAQLTNRLRAMDPWPGTYCFVDGKRLKVLEFEDTEGKALPGELKNYFNTLIVGTLDGALRLKTVQLEGKKKGLDSELLKGWRSDLTLTEPTKEEP